MALYCIVMLNISLELALQDPAYEDMASKFFEHFTHIAGAMNKMSDGYGLWDPEDGFYYDHFKTEQKTFPLRVRSIVGLVPLLAGWVLDSEYLDKLPGFRNRINSFVEKKKALASQVSGLQKAISLCIFYHIRCVVFRLDLPLKVHQIPCTIRVSVEFHCHHIHIFFLFADHIFRSH